MQKYIDKGIHSSILSLSGLTYIHSVATFALVDLLKTLINLSGKLVILFPSKFLLSLLETTNLRCELTVVNLLEDAKEEISTFTHAI